MRNVTFLLTLCCFLFALYNCLEVREEANIVPVAKEQARTCIELYNDCDGSKDDCQCCATNGYCSCYSLFGYLKSGCKCVPGSAEEYYGLCMSKLNCYGEKDDPKSCKSHRRKKGYYG